VSNGKRFVSSGTSRPVAKSIFMPRRFQTVSTFPASSRVGYGSPSYSSTASRHWMFLKFFSTGSAGIVWPRVRKCYCR
jgi:hypothetical protein